MGLVSARALDTLSRYAAAVWRDTCPLGSEFGLEGCCKGDAYRTKGDAYRTLDWLLERQPVIRRRLASRRRCGCDLAFLDMPSSCYEGGKPSLAGRRDPGPAGDAVCSAL
jgi:hypothetical protein